MIGAETDIEASRNALHVAAQQLAVLGRQIVEAHAHPESGRSAGHLALQSQLGLSQSQCDFEFGVHRQWHGHFYEAAALDRVKQTSPSRAASGNSSNSAITLQSLYVNYRVLPRP
jgi:hypothetical protein